ncbi:Erythroid transcription factor [Physocladia obscura]|uniref:Erythroid transcription factor n=1 Tax=Physocladia obscura TaxID=109957 RepID=A0AAD5XF69_9FUNG|nr:Erythroid transcription factor [Physocladia obscura]
MLSPTYSFDLDRDVESLLFPEKHRAFTFEPPTPPLQRNRSYSADYASDYTRSNSTVSSCGSYNNPLVIASNGFMIANDQFSAYEFLLACSTNLVPLAPPLPESTPIPASMPAATPLMMLAPPLTPVPVPRSAVPSVRCGGACPKTPILPSQNYSYSNASSTTSAAKTLASARVVSSPLFSVLHPKPLKPKPVCVNCGGTETSVWRKDRLKNSLCNACGLFRKQHGYDRPQSFPFRKTSVQRRKGKKGSALPRS